MIKKILFLTALFVAVTTIKATTWVANYTNEPLLITWKTTVNPAQFVVAGGGTVLTVAEEIAAKIAKLIIELKMEHPVDKELFNKAVFDYQRTMAGKLNFTETQPVLPGAKEVATFSKFDVLGLSTRTELHISKPDGTLIIKRFWSPRINKDTRGGNFTLKILPAGQNDYKLLMQCNSFCKVGMGLGADYPVDARQVMEK